MYSAVAQASGMLPTNSHVANIPDEDHHLIKADQLDYSAHQVLEPRYEYLPVSLNSLPSNAIPIAANSSTRLEFKLPSARIVNFGRSYIDYGYAAPLIASRAIWTFEDVQDFASDVVLVGSNNAEVARIDNLGIYSKVIRKVDTPLVEMMTNDDLGGLYRSRAAFNRVIGDGYALDTYNEPLYSKATALGSALDLPRQFKLSQLTGTILGTDRNFYCPAEMYMRFNTVKGDNVALSSTSDETVSILAPLVAPLSVPGITMNNVTLWLCVETNPTIIELTVASCLKGTLTYSIPYTTCARLPGSSSINGQTSLQVAYSNMYGHRLKRIITTACAGTETLTTTYDVNNWNAAKTKSYYTSLDNRRLQQRTLSCSAPGNGLVNGDDWAENCRYLQKGVSSITSRDMYSLSWFHIDSFYEIRGVGGIPEANLDRGLDMATPHQWQFNSVAAAANLVHYVFAEFIRPISVSVLGVELLPYELQVANLRIGS